MEGYVDFFVDGYLYQFSVEKLNRILESRSLYNGRMIALNDYEGNSWSVEVSYSIHLTECLLLKHFKHRIYAPILYDENGKMVIDECKAREQYHAETTKRTPV